MKNIGILILFLVLGSIRAEAVEPISPVTCHIEKLSGIQPRTVHDWEVSVEKESKRKKDGDAFLAVDKVTGKRCEIELESWGEGLYRAQAKKSLFLVEQIDTMHTTLTWIDPQECKAIKTLREFGAAKITDSLVSFSGGKDGPTKVPGKKVRLDRECLPGDSSKTY